MSIANRKGGYFTSLEITQDSSHKSESVLTDDLLTKADNYTMHVQHFICSNTQKLNTMDEVMFEALLRGDQVDQPEDVVQDIPENIRQFKPTSYFSTLELARQLEAYINKLQLYMDTNTPGQYVEFTLQQDGCFILTLTSLFTSEFYFKLGPMTQIFTGSHEFIFAVNDGNQDFVSATQDMSALIDDQGYFEYSPGAQRRTEHTYGFKSERPLSSFDCRLSLDVVAAGIPLSTKPQVLDGKEDNNYVLARFPAADYQHSSNKIYSDENGLVERDSHLIERINIGLEDMTRNNTEAISNHLLNGKIKLCNFKIMARYFQDGQLTTVPCDFTHGFFSLKLVFTKKET